MTFRELMYHSSHMPQAMAIMVVGVALGADPVTLAFANAAWWVSREVTQAEKRYARLYPGTQLSHWRRWFKRDAWNAKSIRDWVLPSVVGFFLAALIGV